MSQTQDAPETQAELTFVSDADSPEWHVATDFVVAPSTSVWALCGRWPRSPLGWRMIRRNHSGLQIRRPYLTWFNPYFRFVLFGFGA